MLWFGSIDPADAGELVVEARVPTEIVIGTQRQAQLWRPARLQLDVPAGTTLVTVYIEGSPQTVEITVPEVGAATLVVGRTGVTTGVAEHPAPVEGLRSVEFRVAGSGPVTLQVGERRQRIAAGDAITIELLAGEHSMMVRDAAGTLIYARGTLALSGSGPLVVQLAEGRLPEVVGDGGHFVPESR